ncbi:hypothetical protein ACLOJK_035963 [Asimina triloba]
MEEKKQDIDVVFFSLATSPDPSPNLSSSTGPISRGSISLAFEPSSANLPLPRTLSDDEDPLHHTEAMIRTADPLAPSSAMSVLFIVPRLRSTTPFTTSASSSSSSAAMFPQALIRSSTHRAVDFRESVATTCAHLIAADFREDATVDYVSSHAFDGALGGLLNGVKEKGAPWISSGLFLSKYINCASLCWYCTTEMRLVGALREVLAGGYLGYEEVQGVLLDVLPLNLADEKLGKVVESLLELNYL